MSRLAAKSITSARAEVPLLVRNRSSAGSCPLRGERIVARNQLRRNAGDRERRDGNQTGAVTASHAVEEHATRRRLLDRIEHALEPVGEALDERAVVERGPELGPVHPVDPEIRVLVQPVERDVDRVHAPRVRPALVVVAQIDDRPHAMRAQRLPAGGAQVVDGLGAS
jgi:hypothetical protein